MRGDFSRINKPYQISRSHAKCKESDTITKRNKTRTPYFDGRENFAVRNKRNVLDERSSILGDGKDFFLRHRVKTGFRTHSASYPTGTRGSFPWGKAAGE